MSANLTRLNIADVDDTGENVGAYVKRVTIVEVVDSDGNPWEPVPGPDPFDELVVLQGATWSDSNVYAVGEDIAGTSATYTGGTGNEIYRSRVQHKSATDNDWNNSPWTEHLNVPSVIHFVIPDGEENGSVRFQTQARDTSQDPVVQKNSFASIKNIDPAEWGNVTTTVDGAPYPAEGMAVSTNSPIICAVSFDGNVDDVTYEWERRGTDNVLIGTPNAVQTAVTFPEQGVFSITVTLKSNKTEEWHSEILTFMASPANVVENLNVSTPGISGTPKPGNTLTPTTLNITGGVEPYEITEERWFTGNDPNGTPVAVGHNFIVRQAHVGLTIRYACTVTSADGQTNSVVSYPVTITS